MEPGENIAKLVAELKAYHLSGVVVGNGVFSVILADPETGLPGVKLELSFIEAMVMIEGLSRGMREKLQAASLAFEEAENN